MNHNVGRADARRWPFTDICHCDLNEIHSGGSVKIYFLLSLSVSVDVWPETE